MDKLKDLERIYNQYQKEFSEEEVVTGGGNPESHILLVGEAPGREEVKQGRPFVGAAGKNLDEFLALLNLTREDVYVTNAIKHRVSCVSKTTGRVCNRPSTKKEVRDGRDYLMREIETIRPRFIVTLGNVALSAVLGDNSEGIGAMHGRLNEFKLDRNIFLLYPLYHPASIIYNRKLKQIYADDIFNFKNILENPNY